MQMRMYVDGRFVKHQGFGAQNGDKETRVLIAAEFQSAADGGSVDGQTSFSFTTGSAMSRHLSGSVAEVRVWNAVLTPESLFKHQLQRTTGMCVQYGLSACDGIGVDNGAELIWPVTLQVPRRV